MGSKLARVVGDKTTAEKLERYGLSNPSDIRKASDSQLAQAGLDYDEIEKVRKALPKR